MSGRTEADGETAGESHRFRPDDPGRFFGMLLAASVVTFWLSLVALVAVMLASSEENPTLTATDFPVFVAIGAWVGIWISLLGYSGWSFWRLRRMRDDRRRSARPDRVIGRVFYPLVLPFVTVDDSSAYERRLQRAMQSLLVGLFFLVGIPIGIVYG